MTRRRRWHLLLVAVVVVSARRQAWPGSVWRCCLSAGLDPSPALAVVRHLEANGGLRAADGRLLYDADPSSWLPAGA